MCRQDLLRIAIENFVDRDIGCRLEQLTFHVGFGHRDPLSGDAERGKGLVERGVSVSTDSAWYLPLWRLMVAMLPLLCGL